MREPALHLRAGDRVEPRERLIQREHGLAGEHRAQERDALAHPARELRRERALKPAEAKALKPRRRGGARLVPSNAAGA